MHLLKVHILYEERQEIVGVFLGNEIPFGIFFFLMFGMNYYCMLFLTNLKQPGLVEVSLPMAGIWN